MESSDERYAGRDEEDLRDIILQMHEDWTAREEQFRSCVSELEEIAVVSASHSEKLEMEVKELHELLSEKEATRRASSLSKSSRSLIESATEIDSGTGEFGSSEELSEYLKCSLLECSETIEKYVQTCSVDDTSRESASAVAGWPFVLRLKDYAKCVALPLAFHYTLAGISRPENRNVYLEKWHAKAVMPIQILENESFEGIGDHLSEEENLIKIIDSLHELSFNVNSMPFNVWVSSAAGSHERK